MAQPMYKPVMFGTYEAFLDWERLQPVRHDLIEGVPIAMAGASEGHNIIQGNLFAALLGLLRGSPCRPFPSDMAVKTGPRKGRYPDVTVDCGPRNRENRSLLGPKAVFEVLSPETQGDDRTVKLWEYNEVRTIAYYVLVEQAEPLLYVYSRGEGGDFKLRPQELHGLDGTLDLPAIGVALPMIAIYEGLDFQAAAEPDAQPTKAPWTQ